MDNLEFLFAKQFGTTQEQVETLCSANLQAQNISVIETEYEEVQNA